MFVELFSALDNGKLTRKWQQQRHLFDTCVDMHMPIVLSIANLAQTLAT